MSPASLPQVRIVLASSSPRRQRLLADLGLEFEVRPADVDETVFPEEDPDSYVERLARAKAQAVIEPGEVVIGADTTVVHRGVVLGKPAHPAEAAAMLRRLSGESHTVHTGLAVATFDEYGPQVVSAVERTIVRMLDLTDDEIAGYVASGEPFDKAGAYALQGLGAVLVESVTGSPSNVIGLPLHRLASLLATAGVYLLTPG